jgi:hypothetical protein
MSTNARLLKIDSPAAQVISGVTYVVMLFVLLYVIEMIYFASNSSATRFKTLVGFTAASTDSMIVIRQNLAAFPDANPIGLSVNERTGIEFSYSFYLLVQPETMDGTDSLKHEFHKGYSRPWPLMSPGVFMKGDTNTMRVFMSTYANPYTYVDVKNIPIKKWVHVVLNSYNRGLDIFINGNIAKCAVVPIRSQSEIFLKLVTFICPNEIGRIIEIGKNHQKTEVVISCFGRRLAKLLTLDLRSSIFIGLALQCFQ